MSKVRDLLETKSIKGVLSISPTASVTDAVKMLAEHNVGALVVMEDGFPIGVISERDLLRQAVRDGLAGFEKRTVEGVMSRDMLIAVLDDDVAYVSSIMTKNKIRHLPVIHKNQIIGLVSIGDVVYSQILDEQHEKRMLMNYIEGKYPA